MKKEIQQIEAILSTLKTLKNEDKIEFSVPTQQLPFQIGKAYLIRTVTLYYTGRVADIVGKFLILDECAWIADTGRFMQAIKEGKFNEVEPMGNSVIVNSDAVIDAVSWNLSLPKDQK